jgi:hypothetical protein
MFASEDDIKRDTACFSPRQWYIKGICNQANTPMFSTREDAVAALQLAGMAMMKAREELADKIRDVL